MVIEDLNVRGMMSNRRLARALADAGISGFLGKLAYKCRWYGAELVRGSRWYPSSRLCSQCGHRNDSLTLWDRQWACPSCGAVNERDLNAALNLERAGFELPGAGRGDRVRPALVCEASSESRFEAWPPAKLEYQILNSGAPLPYRAGAGVVSTSGSRGEFSGIPAPHGERKRQTMTRWVCATIRPR